MDKRDPKHLAWVREQTCCVPLCLSRPSIIAHHVRSAATSGTGMKPPDSSTVPLCMLHHDEGHHRGWKTFEDKYGIDLTEAAAWYASVSGQDLP